MSFDYSIEGVFDLVYSEGALEKIFKSGVVDGGLEYSIFEPEGWNGMPEMASLTASQAVQKTLDYQEGQDYGPIICVLYVSDSGIKRELHMRVYEANLRRVKICWNCLDQTRIRFADGEEGVDFPYFINKFIDLYGQFNMISLEATYF